MSRVFAWFMLVISLLMLLIAVSNLEATKPVVILLWVVVAFASIYSLFFKPNKAQQIEAPRVDPSE